MTVSDDKFTRQTLLEVHGLTPSLFTLRTTRDAGFRFRAGQFVRLGVEKVDDLVHVAEDSLAIDPPAARGEGGNWLWDWIAGRTQYQVVEQLVIREDA